MVMIMATQVVKNRKKQQNDQQKIFEHQQFDQQNQLEHQNHQDQNQLKQNHQQEKSEQNDQNQNHQIQKNPKEFLNNQLNNELLIDNSSPISIQLRLNINVLILFTLALSLRLYELDKPSSIVFDELHYGRFVSLYLRRTFFFDSQPPLGKQLIALNVYLFSDYNFNNVDNVNNFTNIGQEYDKNFPIRSFRFIPAICGSLLIPILYQFIVEIGFNHNFAFLSSLLFVFENSLLTQSRFILLDTILLFFSTVGLLSYLLSLKFNLFTSKWFLWNLSASIALTFGLCVKYIGIYTLLQIILLSFWQLFEKISDKTIRTAQLWLLLLYNVLIYLLLPLIIYCLIFYIHLSILIKAGPHDNIMTSAFQASLEGGLASIIRGQPINIVHGSQITLRNTHGRTCWLHSHPAVYPIRYPDKRGSSHQQQVTCYSFKDVNNWWIVKRPHINDLITHEPHDNIKNGDVIQLVHGLTGRTLNSHDIAAPMSPYNQEVSCYIDYNISMEAQNLWKVKLLNSDDTNDYWHAIRSRVQLIHLNSSQALKLSGLQLPNWGHHQHEIVTEKQLNNPNTIWNVEEHRYTRNSDEKELERELGMAEFVPLQPTLLSFWDKMYELQYKMLIQQQNQEHQQQQIQNHLYSNESPIDWPLLTKGIAYWLSRRSNAQIYLIGNIFLWYLGIVSLSAYWAIFLFYQFRRKRNIYDISQENYENFLLIGKFISIGYLIHFLPYFFTEQTLFLHHYLPALIFKLLSIPLIIGHLNQLSSTSTSYKRRLILQIIFLIILIISFIVFIKFLPFSYGFKEFTVNDIMKLKYKKTWHFLIHHKRF